jgi:hypothetical protein
MTCLTVTGSVKGQIRTIFLIKVWLKIKNQSPVENFQSRSDRSESDFQSRSRSR